MCCQDSCFQHKICKEGADDLILWFLVVITSIKLVVGCPAEKYICKAPIVDESFRQLACEEGDCPSNYKCCPDSCFSFKICKESVGLVTEDVPSSVTVPSTTTTSSSSSTFPATESVTALTITKSTEATNTVTSSPATSTETIGSGSGDEEDYPTTDRYITNTSTVDIISQLNRFLILVRFLMEVEAEVETMKVLMDQLKLQTLLHPVLEQVLLFLLVLWKLMEAGVE
jgi:hypothetical protein